MNMTTENPADGIDVSKLVYIRALRTQELADLPNEALEAVKDPERLYVVSNADGVRIAIIEGRKAAEAAAHAYSLVPMSVH
jgi:hypothetical protein